jgi:hypothetical protein
MSCYRVATEVEILYKYWGYSGINTDWNVQISDQENALGVEQENVRACTKFVNKF